MSKRKDPLEGENTPDRVYFATGMMLDAGDFLDEQAYHRGRLARALAFTHGTGTVAGLNVGYRLRSGAGGGAVEELVVSPGLAIDRQGRLIELRREACIRLDRWYAEQAESKDHAAVEALAQAWAAQADHGVAAAAWDGVVADVFVRFAACERGKTPAFAEGPFDALDAVQPSRVRDGYELQLILRPEDNLPQRVPPQGWPSFADTDDPAQRRRKLQDAILTGWPGNAATPTEPPALDEYPANQADRLAVFLARVVIQAAQPNPGRAPVRTPRPAPPQTDADAGAVVKIDNHLRLFIYMPQALARALGM